MQNKIKKYKNGITYILADRSQATNDFRKEKTTRSVMINTFLTISSRPQGNLHHLCNF